MKKQIYQPPVALDLGATVVMGQVQPQGACMTGTLVTGTLCTQGSRVTSQSNCVPTGMGAPVLFCAPGGGGVPDCVSGQLA